LIRFQLFVRPPVANPNSFLVESVWWKSKASMHLLYPHISHLLPLYSTAIFLSIFLRLLTASTIHFRHRKPLPSGLAEWIVSPCFLQIFST